MTNGVTRRRRVVHAVATLHAGAFVAAAEIARDSPWLEHSFVALETDPARTAAAKELLGDSLAAHKSRRQFIVEVGRTLQTPDVSVVHAHSSIAGAIVRSLPARSDVRRLYSPHCFAFERTDVRPSTRRAFRSVERLLASRTDVLVAVSPREVMLARALGHRRVVELPHSLPLELVAPGTSDQCHESQVPLIVGVGRLSPQKNPAMFAEIATASADVMDFLWVGDGDPRLRRVLEAAGVRVTGWCSRRQVLHTISRADLLLHTAAWEGAPIVFAEARYLGVPIVAARTPSVEALGVTPTFRSAEEARHLLRAYARGPARDLLLCEQAKLDEHFDQERRASILEHLYA